MTSPMATLSSPHDPAAAHILVVDDVEKNTRLLADLLGARGYRTSKASSGPQALDLIEGGAPDLVLLDVMMPGMSGYEVCRTLRADPRHALLPVVLVTALDPATERANGLDAGADDFINKPINQSELLARVRSLLRLKTLQDQLLRERSGPSAPPMPSVPKRETHRSVMVALSVAWPAMSDAATRGEPDSVLAAIKSLLDRIAEAAQPLEATLANAGALGMTVLFDASHSGTEAVQRARKLAAHLQSLKEGLRLGLADGTATVGMLNLHGGGLQCIAVGPAVQTAHQLGSVAAADELCVAGTLSDLARH
jgi:CheY-like chemotaxis protein